MALSKTLTVPHGVLEIISKKGIEMNSHHLTYAVIRQILTHIDNGKDNLALNLIAIKTQWSKDRVSDFFNFCVENGKQFMLLRIDLAQKILKEEKKKLIDDEILILSKRKELLLAAKNTPYAKGSPMFMLDDYYDLNFSDE